MLSEKTKNIAAKLFVMACTGDIENLDTYLKTTGSLDITHRQFGEEYSLIMGAYRNRQWDTVRWLVRHGAKLTAKEQEYINQRYMDLVILEELQNIISGDK